MNSFSIAFQLYNNNNDDIIFNGQVILLPVLTKWSLQNFALGTAAVLSWRAKPYCDQMAQLYYSKVKFPSKFELWGKKIVRCEPNPPRVESACPWQQNSK